MTVANEGVLRRVGVVGDIHGEDRALDLALRHLSGVGAETVLAVGDMVDGVGDVDRVCSLLAAHGVLTVAGNHDRWWLSGSMRELPDATPASALRPESRAWLEQLPKTRSFQTGRGPLLLCHGLGEDDMAMVGPDDDGYALELNLGLQSLLTSKRSRFVVNGHSHLPMVRDIGTLTIINAGTLDRRYRQTFAVADFDQGSVEFFQISSGAISSAERFAIY